MRTIFVHFYMELFLFYSQCFRYRVFIFIHSKVILYQSESHLSSSSSSSSSIFYLFDLFPELLLYLFDATASINSILVANGKLFVRSDQGASTDLWMIASFRFDIVHQFSCAFECDFLPIHAQIVFVAFGIVWYFVYAMVRAMRWWCLNRLFIQFLCKCNDNQLGLN